MSMWLRQSTASQEIELGIFVDSVDGNSAEDSLTIANTDIKIWKEGATTLADKNSGGATHISGGYYSAVLDATDTATLGKLVVHVHVAGALAVKREYLVVPAMVYDSIVLGTDRFDSNMTHAADTAWGSGAITAASIAADAITDAKVASDVTIASVTGNVGGNVVGSVASVVGAVGSVTGNVGGNVVGSVGSLVGHTNQTGDVFPRITGTGAVTFESLTVSGATTLTGNLALAAGLTITQSTVNGNAVDITGNGTGKGLSCFGGATGINSHGALFQGGAGGGHGVAAFGIGVGSGLICTAGATGTAGLQAYGGAGSGYGLLGKSGATGGAGAYWWGWGTNAIGEWAVGSGTGAGCYIESAANAHGLHIAGSGSGQGVHIKGGATGPGLEINGGATSGDGVLVTVVSGAGVLADITGNITGNLSGSAGSVTGNVGGNVVGSVGSVVGAIGSITGVTFPSNFGSLGINASGHITRATLVDTLTTYTGNTLQTGDSFARIGALGAGLTALSSQTSVTAITGTALTESYAAPGAAMTLPQLLYGTHQTIHDSSISVLTRTTNKRDGTAAFTSLFDANPPTSITQ